MSRKAGWLDCGACTLETNDIRPTPGLARAKNRALRVGFTLGGDRGIGPADSASLLAQELAQPGQRESSVRPPPESSGRPGVLSPVLIHQGMTATIGRLSTSVGKDRTDPSSSRDGLVGSVISRENDLACSASQHCPAMPDQGGERVRSALYPAVRPNRP